MAPTAHLAARPVPPRIPKLAYRNSRPADHSSLPSSSTSASDTHSDGSHSLPQPRSTATSSTTGSSISQSFDSPSVASVTLASHASSSSASKGAKKKKTHAVLSFLNLREPSQSALEQFAQSQRKHAAERGGNAAPTSMAGVSPQKLPSNVPKVNSKWDGIPEAVKAKQSSASGKRASTSFHATSDLSGSRATASLPSVASGGVHTPTYSLVSSPSSITNTTCGNTFSSGAIYTVERRDSGPSIASTEKAHSSSPSMSSLPTITYFFPGDLNLTGELSAALPDGSGNKPSSVPSASTTKPKQMVSTPNYVMSGGLNDSDGGADLDINAILQSLPDKDHGLLAGEAHHLTCSGDEGDAISSEAKLALTVEAPRRMSVSPLPSLPSPTSPRSPRPVNFSRPLSSPPLPASPDLSRLSISSLSSSKSLPSTLPTLYEASPSEEHRLLALDEASSGKDAVAHAPDLSQTQAKESNSVSVATSFIHLAMTESWRWSSRERLGLGGRFQKTDVSPWESPQELVPGKRKKKHLSIFTRTTA